MLRAHGLAQGLCDGALKHPGAVGVEGLQSAGRVGLFLLFKEVLNFLLL